MNIDGERIEKGIQQLYRDLLHGKFTLKELKFFEIGFKKLAEATYNIIKRAESDKEEIRR